MSKEEKSMDTMTNKETYTDQILDRLDKLEARIDAISKEKQEKQSKNENKQVVSFGAQYAEEYSKKFE